MKQILIKKGNPIVVELPAPGASEGMILVEVKMMILEDSSVEEELFLNFQTTKNLFNLNMIY